MKVEIECVIHGKQMLGVSCGLCDKTEAALKAELAQSRKECEEQARMNDMGASREAKLMAELEDVKDDLTFEQNERQHLQDQFKSESERIAALTEAIYEYGEERLQGDTVVETRWLRVKLALNPQPEEKPK